ncbi:hypothetical protein PGT21_028596 [Puccinia graminis f. sp. tritici]|uniref:SET domain-containing protein n=1 Tax=Puccinia graminis f. sp. tritici TaxID=56615 RepID=A0A5B0RU15_PUCGR|nr:hypothetical protein PGT21_028596 [Puccinia graminis f. sp. tritici]KAA1127964.1 hypothetical protein PGTUg99_008997 [Puccinia graminis f. sp. tritici]
MTQQTSQEWIDLLEWLERNETNTGEFKATMRSSTSKGRSLVATEDIEESTSILSLPRSVLLDTKTIPQEFVEKHCLELTSTQALSLFLTVYRSSRRNCADPDRFEYPFGCYLSTLPDDLSGIPLVWQLRAVFGKMDEIDPTDLAQLDRLQTHVRPAPPPTDSFNPFDFYQLMTPTTINQAEEVLLRFIDDWAALVPTLRDCYPNARLWDLLWAWLIVNTRCVSFNIGAKKMADNISLAPAFDMANHSPISRVTAVANEQTLTMYSTQPAGLGPTNPALSFPHSSPSDQPCMIRKGQEITFSYGPHANSTLLTEYGFVASEPNPWDSIDVTDHIVALFDRSDPTHLKKIELLKNTDYWEDYTIQCDPLESSHRNLVALRLLHTPEGRLAEWEAHIDGLADELSRDIEQAVRRTLDELFDQLQAKSRALVQKLEGANICFAKLGLSAYSAQCLVTLAANELKALSSYSPSTD